MARALVQPVTDRIDPLAEPDELLFRFDTGRVSLDLVRTAGERWRRSFERLRAPDDLGRWLVGAGLLDGPAAVSPEQLREARALREAVFRLARAAMDDTEPARTDV